MTTLFPLQLLHDGTARVENFASYLSRLACAHAVSTWQLLDTTMAFRRGGGELNIQGRDQLTTSAISGSGLPASQIVSRIQQLTGQDNLSNATILQFKLILSRDCLGCLSSQRRWCSACMLERDATEAAWFEPLIWQFRAIRHCSIHQILLRDSCPYCGKNQRRLFKQADLSICVACKRSLARSGSCEELTNHDRWLHRQISDLLAHPCYDADEWAFARFLRAFQEVWRTSSKASCAAALGIDDGGFRLLARREAKPRLLTVLRAAASTSVDVRTIFTTPEDCVRQIDAFRIRDKIRDQRRHHVSQDRRSKVEARIDNAIELLEAGTRAPTLASLCRDHGVAVEFAHYWFPLKAKRLGELRRRFYSQMRDRAFKEALLVATTVSNEHPRTAKRGLEKRIASIAAVSKRTAMRALAAALRERANQLQRSGHP